MSLLEIKNLRTHFKLPTGSVKAVDDVSLSIGKGESVGLVGESGSGKSMLSHSILRLIPQPGKIVSGEILLNGIDLLNLPEKEMRKIRGKRIAMIFQEPMTSLNPVFTIGDQIAEAIELHEGGSAVEVEKRVVEMLRLVGIPSPEERKDQYPHEMSGGMRQRVMIAMALACKPDLLIADEPTTALDVTIQAQILTLIKKLQQEFGMALLLISHDLGVIAQVCEKVCVMYAGELVEQSPVLKIFDTPQHPYTQGLLKSIPKLKKMGRDERMETIEGDMPKLLSLPSGCYFQERCPKKQERCFDHHPDWEKKGGEEFVRCFYPGSEPFSGRGKG